MRRFLALSVATAVLSFGGIQAGSAADMGLPGPLKAPPPAAVAWTWTGFYIGGNFGAGWGTTECRGDCGAVHRSCCARFEHPIYVQHC